MPNYVALSPPPQLLQYILDYLVDTPAASQKDLWEVRLRSSYTVPRCIPQA